MKKILIISLTIIVSATLAFSQTDTGDSDKDEGKKEKSKQEYIADLASEKDEATIIDAAKWLGVKKEKSAMAGLLALVGDSRENVRIESIVALGLIAQEDSVDALNEAMVNDKSAEVRYAALLATMRIGSKKSIEFYKQSMDKESDPFIKDLLKKLEEKYKGK